MIEHLINIEKDNTTQALGGVFIVFIEQHLQTGHWLFVEYLVLRIVFIGYTISLQNKTQRR